MKIVLIGAGSHSFGGGQIVDMLMSEELKKLGGELVLVDEDEFILELMTQFARRVKKRTGGTLSIDSSTDRCKALPGSDYVIVSVARKRMELWEQDFRVPLSHGFRHCLGENGGPGAAFHALRSLNLVIPICRDVENICPDALVMNFTNPEARVLHAVCHLTKARAAGFCHGIMGAVELLSRVLGRPEDRLEVLSAGMNHLFTVLSVKDLDTGEELFDTALGKIMKETGEHTQLFRKLAEHFGILTYPSDDHIGEYMAYGSEFTGIKWPYGRECERVVPGVEDGPSRQLLKDLASGKKPVDENILVNSGELTVPVIADIELDRGSFRPAVNVLNTEGYISNLPRTAAVEIPATVDSEGIHPVSVGAIAEPFAEIIRRQCPIIELTTEAYDTGKRRPLLQALLLDPVVNSISEAETMLDYMLDLQKDYLPQLS